VLETNYRNHSDYVFRVCLKFAGGDRDWALDRVHDVFMRLNEHQSGLSSEQDLRPWLRKVAVNECLMDLRRRDRRRRLLGVFGLSVPTRAAATDDALAASRDAATLDRALARLPAKQRALLALIYFEGETLTSAAELIGVSKGQASKLRATALKTLGREDWNSEP
jgi:RNA polymerase sigma factor (sigma-70 family)